MPGRRQPMAVGSRLRHIIESQQFSRALLEELFVLADDMKSQPHRYAGRLKGQVMAALFYEPSTRTRLSFEAAMLRLGGRTMGTDNAREFSSAAKGETIEDTIRIVSGYSDVIVLRHYEEGAARRAAAVSSVPVINAGDGPGQHPTQALLDLYTIRAELGKVDGVRVAMVGDLANGRTVRSLTYLLSKFKDVKVWFVAPPEVAMREDLKAHLDEHHVPWLETEDLAAVLPEVDVVYMTRIQKERFSDLETYDKVTGVYRIDKDALARMRKYAVLMHPLSRIAHEIVERNRGVDGVVLVGIVSKGDVLARRLAATLSQLEESEVRSGRLDVTSHRDDLHLRPREGRRPVSEIPEIDGKVVVLVDDVIHHGRTARAAMDALMDFGRPRAIQLAVLVDRGHRELPIRPDYVGKNVPTADSERIEVLVAEEDGLDQAVIVAG